MPVQEVRNKKTGAIQLVDESEAKAGLASGIYEPVGKVVAETGTGDQFAVEAADVGSLGLTEAGPEAAAQVAQQAADEERFGDEGLSAFSTGLGLSASLGLSALGGTREDREERRRLVRTNPGSTAAGQLVGDLALGVASAAPGAVGRAASLLPGGAVSRASERLVAGGLAGSRVAGAVAGGALEGAAGAAADYLAQEALSDRPQLSGEAFAAHLGVGSLLGGAIGGGLGSVGGALERRAARRQAGALADEAADTALDVERAAMGVVDDLAAEADRVPLASLVPPRAATPEGVAERVSGVYGALRQADAERVALQREIDDTVMPGLDMLEPEQAAAVRTELGQATSAYKSALDDAKGWARGLGREQRAMTRARLDEERIAQAQARTRGVQETVEQRLERERLRTERVAAGPQRRRPPTAEPEQLTTAIPAEQPGDDLLAQLQRTQDQLGAGRSLSDVSAEGTAQAAKRAPRGRQPKMPDGFEHGPHISPKARRIKGIPEAVELDEEALYVVKASDLRARGDLGLAEGVQDARKASIQRGWADGKKFEPIDVTIYGNGKVEIAQGRHRLWAAAEEGRDIPVRFSRGIEEPTKRGKEAVSEWLAKYKRDTGVRYVDSATGAPARGISPRAVDKVVSFEGQAIPDYLPAPIDIASFRGLAAGERAERMAASRALDSDIEIPAALAQERSPLGGMLDEIQPVDPGTAQVGRVLDGDSDDAVEVFARLDEAAEVMRRAIARARSAQHAPGVVAVGLPDAPTQPGLARSVAGAAQNVGSALEVASALGVPVPSAGQIPVVGPALSAYLKMRAAWRALRGSGATVPATASARAASAKVRMEAAARAAADRVLELGEKAMRSTLLPGMVGRQAGRLADRLNGEEAEQREVQAEIDSVMSADPGGLQIQIARSASGAPLPVTAGAQQAATRAVAYLQEVAPKPAGYGTPWAQRPRYSPTEIAQWRQRYAAVQMPQATASALAGGMVAPWAKEAMVRVWPQIWALYREELGRQQDVLAKLSRPQRVAIGRNYDLVLDPSRIPGYPTATASAARVQQDAGGGAAPTRSAQPSSKPRIAELMATPEQATVIQ